MKMDREDRHLATEQVPLLIFELGGQLYGVDVDQVEAIVERQASFQGPEIQVQDLAVWIGLELSEEGEASRLLLSRSSGALRGFMVNTPKDVIALSLDGIFPIPPLIRRVLGRSPLWGVGQWAQGLILLVDLTLDL